MLGLLLLVGQKLLWLYALNDTLKKQRRARYELRLGDVSQLVVPEGANLDLQELETLTVQLRQSGFSILGDVLSELTYAPAATSAYSPIVDPHQPLEKPSSVTTDTTGIARIFIHPRHRCYASLIAVMAVTRFDPALGKEDIVNVAPFRTVILSMGEGDDSWCFANHNREVDPFSELHRQPRKLSHRMVDASPQQLLDAHLAERADIARRGNFSWDNAPSMEKYLKFEKQYFEGIRQYYETANFFAVALFLHTYKLKKHEWWLGEL